MEEVGRYLSRDGTEKNLIRLPCEIGRKVGSIGRECWYLMTLMIWQMKLITTIYQHVDILLVYINGIIIKISKFK